jgi:nitrite reductase/ring-hydroxylating ferredoxin subunit
MTSVDRLKSEVPLCKLSDLQEMQAVEMVVEQRQLFAVRHGDCIYAYWNICPHMGSPLNWVPNQFLDINQESIQCALHGALFDIKTGQCFLGPCHGDSLQTAELRCVNHQYFITAGQPLPPIPVNLRAQALADLERE